MYAEEKEMIYLNQVSLPRSKLVYKLSGLFLLYFKLFISTFPRKMDRERKTFHLLLLLLIDFRKLAGAKKSRANYEN